MRYEELERNPTHDYDRCVAKLCQISDKRQQLTLIYQWVKAGNISKNTFLMLFKDYIHAEN